MTKEQLHARVVELEKAGDRDGARAALKQLWALVRGQA